jgi:hypothetical protein
MPLPGIHGRDKQGGASGYGSGLQEVFFGAEGVVDFVSFWVVGFEGFGYS